MLPSAHHHKLVTLFTRASVILADILVLTVTWTTSFKMRGRAPLSAVLLRDGMSICMAFSCMCLNMTLVGTLYFLCVVHVILTACASIKLRRSLLAMNIAQILVATIVRSDSVSVNTFTDAWSSRQLNRPLPCWYLLACT